jgi:hypothetical protein
MNALIQKKITILVFLLVVSLKNNAGNENPLKDFCLKNKIHEKSVIIALSLSDCAVCYTPPDELLNRIRKFNMEIPVYVVTDEDMAEGEKNIFRNKFGVYANSLIFISNRSTYHYMIAEKGGLPSVCCVSESGDILVIKHLKHDNLEDFYKIIISNFEVSLINKTEFKSNYISPKKHDGAFYINNSICLFHQGTNVIAKYNMDGNNIKNMSIDSLKIDYLQLARQLFPEKLYKSSEKDYKINHPKKSNLIRVCSVIKMGKDTLCALINVIATGDTLFNNKPKAYNRGYGCMFLFDADLNYIDTKLFFSQEEAAGVNFYLRGAYSDHKFYLGRYDTTHKQHVMAEYELKNSTLFLKKQFDVPKNQELKNGFPIFPSISTSLNNIYISYFKANDKRLITSIKTYKLNKSTNNLSEEITSDEYWFQMHATKGENYLLWTIDKNYTSVVKGYDKKTKQLTDCKEKLGAKAQNEERLFFVIDGQLLEYAYTE